MVTTEPTPNPQSHHSVRREGACSERPTVKATLRSLNLVAGTVVAFVAFVIVGLYGAAQHCAGEERKGLCAGHARLVPVLEWPIVVLAFLAPFAGGIAAFMTRRPRWLALGVAGAFVMFALMSLVSTGQTHASLFS